MIQWKYVTVLSYDDRYYPKSKNYIMSITVFKKTQYLRFLRAYYVPLAVLSIIFTMLCYIGTPVNVHFLIMA
jgi:hypothetical protein